MSVPWRTVSAGAGLTVRARPRAAILVTRPGQFLPPVEVEEDIDRNDLEIDEWMEKIRELEAREAEEVREGRGL